MCQHQPACPPPGAPDRQAARVVAPHPEQGWSPLCNGVVAFDDTGALLPNGRSSAASAGSCWRRAAVLTAPVGLWNVSIR